jgi:hypothetical protein
MAACSQSPETATLRAFFDASRLRDRTALATLSTIALEPHTDGMVGEFEVLELTPARRRDLSGGLDGPATREVVELSLAPGHAPAAQSGDRAYPGGRIGLVARDVVIDAVVRTFDRSIRRRRLVVTLERAERRGDEGETAVGRWIVTAVRQTG